MTSADFGAFVLGLAPLIRREALRLIRRGVTLDVDDAVQGVTLWLLEHEHVSREAGAQLIRRRLVDLFVRPSMKQPVMISIDVAADGDLHFGESDDPERTTEKELSIESHEDSVIDRVTAAQLLDLIPPSTSADPGNRDEMQRRWIPRLRTYVGRAA